MPNIIRIINLQLDTDLSGATFPVDKLSYTENAKRVNILDLKNYILSGVTGGTYDLSKYLAISGGTLTGLLEGPSISMTAPDGFATADFWTYNSATATTYGLNVVGINGESRKIFLAGQQGVSNGFTVDWNNIATRFSYAFNAGDVNVEGCISGYTFVKIGGGTDQSLQADGSVRTLVSGNYFPLLINTSQISSSSLSHAIFSRVGDVIHIRISGYLVPSGVFPVLELSLPTSYNMVPGVKIGIGTMWNWTSGSTMVPGYIETKSGNAVYFRSNISGTTLINIPCDFVVEFDYSLTGGVTTTTTTTVLTGSTTTTTTTASLLSKVSFNHITGTAGVMGISGATGQTFSLTFNYNLTAYCDNNQTQQPNQATSSLSLSTNGGVSYSTIDSVVASVDGLSPDQNDTQTLTGSTTISSITDITLVRVNSSLDCSFAGNGQSGTASATISLASVDFGSTQIICNNDYYRDCSGGASLICL